MSGVPVVAAVCVAVVLAGVFEGKPAGVASSLASACSFSSSASSWDASDVEHDRYRKAIRMAMTRRAEPKGFQGVHKTVIFLFHNNITFLSLIELLSSFKTFNETRSG